jgi:hypothetical protein
LCLQNDSHTWIWSFEENCKTLHTVLNICNCYLKNMDLIPQQIMNVCLALTFPLPQQVLQMVQECQKISSSLPEGQTCHTYCYTVTHITIIIHYRLGKLLNARFLKLLKFVLGTIKINRLCVWAHDKLTWKDLMSDSLLIIILIRYIRLKYPSARLFD